MYKYIKILSWILCTKNWDEDDQPMQQPSWQHHNDFSKLNFLGQIEDVSKQLSCPNKTCAEVIYRHQPLGEFVKCQVSQRPDAPETATCGLAKCNFLGSEFAFRLHNLMHRELQIIQKSWG